MPVHAQSAQSRGFGLPPPADWALAFPECRMSQRVMSATPAGGWPQLPQAGAGLMNLRGAGLPVVVAELRRVQGRGGSQ